MVKEAIDSYIKADDPTTYTEVIQAANGAGEMPNRCTAVPVFSPAKIEGVGERCILGGASVHIKGFGSTPIPLQRQISTEGIGGPYIPLKCAGENTVYSYM